MFGKGISSDTFKGRGDLSKRTRQRPSGRADVDVSAFEILILFALCPFHYANETGLRERGSFNKRAYYALGTEASGTFLLTVQPEEDFFSMLQKKGKDSFPLPGAITLSKCTRSVDKYLLNCFSGARHSAGPKDSVMGKTMSLAS